MEKKILLDQLNDRVMKALALLVSLSPKVVNGELETPEVVAVLDIVDGLKCMLSAIVDIQYNDNLDKYKDLIYEIAKGIH